MKPAVLSASFVAGPGPTRAVRGMLALAFAAALLLAGCSTPPPAEVTEDHVHAAPVPAPHDIVEVLIPDGAAAEAADGPYFQLERPVFEVPVILRFVNHDDAPHHVLGDFEHPEATAPWVEADHHAEHARAEAAAEDGPSEEGHGGHPHGSQGGSDHGSHDAGGAGPHGFDFTVEAGKSHDVHVDQAGRIRIGCDPHAWMVAQADAVDAQAHAFDVVVHQWIRSGTMDGVSRMGHDGEDVAHVNLSLEAPNLVAVDIAFTWDDAQDDGPLGGEANHPDAFQVKLLDPTGTGVAQDRLEARSGRIGLNFTRDMAWPDTVDGRSDAEAADRLAAAYPDDRQRSGVWQVEVALLWAPGYLPHDLDDGGTFHDAPEDSGADGGQSWELAVTAVHEWATVGGQAAVVDAVLDLAGEEGHEH